MRVVVIKAYFPFFSVRVFEAYQVAVSYPFLPPSTIVGALGRGLAEAGRCRGAECIELARRLVKKARDAGGAAAKTAVVLKRARGVLEEGRLPSDMKEIRGFSDALLREYVASAPRHLLVIPSGDVEAVEEAAWHIERFGDSESLASVEVEVAEAEKCEGSHVNVVVDLEEARGGVFTVYTAHDEGGAARDFAVPVKPGGKVGVYEPGLIEVASGVRCVGDVRFPASWI